MKELENSIRKIFQKEKWRLLNEPEGSTKYLISPIERINEWKFFLNQFDRKNIILDFGCGAGYSLFVGEKLGLDIIGLDIKGDKIYPKIHQILKINPIFYSGYRMPFKNNFFNVLIFHWSICFDFEKKIDLKKRCQELERISKKDAIWFIAPQQHINKIKTKNKIIKFEL